MPPLFFVPKAECAKTKDLATRLSAHADSRCLRTPAQSVIRAELTPRERQVVSLLPLPDKSIAFRLGVSHRTAQSLLASARLKLGASNRTEAALKFREFSDQLSRAA
jgi:DNA-binding NarL/FixJ family response regulator